MGLALDTEKSELFLDQQKGNSVLAWSRPNSLAELQSRLFSLQYFSRFYLNLKCELAPLYLILRNKEFYWDESCETSWKSMKAIVLSDLKLSIPSEHNQLVLYTDASSIACSQVLFMIDSDESFKVVSCNSKIFSHFDSNKDTHLKEAISLCLGIKTYMPYLLNSLKPILILTDARNLIRISRQKERSILCSSMSNFLSKMSRYFNYNIFHVPANINILADIFSRAFVNSRYIQNGSYNLSKEAAANVPPLEEPFQVSSSILYTYFTSEILPEPSDKGSRTFSKPRTLDNVFQMYKSQTPEKAYLDAILLIKQVSREVHKRNITNYGTVQFQAQQMTFPNNADTSENKEFILTGNPPLSTPLTLDFTDIDRLFSEKTNMSISDFKTAKLKLFSKYINDIVEDRFGSEVLPIVRTKIRNSLLENLIKMEKIEEYQLTPEKISDDTKTKIRQQLEHDIKIASNIPYSYEEIQRPPGSSRSEIVNMVSLNFSEILTDQNDIITANFQNPRIMFQSPTLSAYPSTTPDLEIIPTIEPIIAKGLDPTKILTINKKSEISPIYYTCSGKYEPKSHAPSAGIDLFQQEDKSIQPYETIIVDTDTRINIPANHVGLLYLRSSASRNGLAANVGVIDNNFMGTIKLCIKNLNPHTITLQSGESYSQLVIQKNITPSLINQDFTFPTNREENGFGSTGNSNINLRIENNPLKIFNIPSTVIKVNNISCYFIDAVSLETLESSLLKEDIHNVMCIENIQNAIPELIKSANQYVQLYQNNIRSSNPGILQQYLQLQSEKLATLNTDIILDNNISLENFKLLQRSDEIYSNIITDLEKDRKHTTFKLSSGLLYKTLQTSPEPKTLLCIPTIILPHVINTLHKQLNHPSSNQLKKAFYRYFFHPLSSTGIQATNRSCITCRLATNLKPDLHKIVNEKRTISAKFPRHVFAMDIIPNLPKSGPYSDILLVTDEYTKFIMLFPLVSKSSDSIYTALHQLFTYSGYIPYLRADNEISLIQAIKRLWKLFPITLLSSAPYSHQQNGLAEKGVGLFKQHVTKLIHDSTTPQEKSSWYQNLPLITEYINSTIYNKTKYTRAELFFGSTKTSLFSNIDESFPPHPISTTYIDKLIPLLNKTTETSKHTFLEGDIVCRLREYVTIGTKKVFSTHFLPTLFKVTSTPEDSTDLILQDLKSGIQSTIRADKLQKIDLQTYNSLFPDELFDTKILDKLKTSTKVDENILTKTLFNILPYELENLDPDTMITDAPNPTTPPKNDLLSPPKLKVNSNIDDLNLITDLPSRITPDPDLDPDPDPNHILNEPKPQQPLPGILKLNNVQPRRGRSRVKFTLPNP